MPKTAAPVTANLAKGSRVVATIDMKGVPAGTPGKVILVEGLSWTRYWVWFDNGPRVGQLHRSKLATLDEWANRGVKKVAPAGAASAVGVDVAPGDDAAGGDVGGVPAALLERSRKARERLGAKKA